MSVNRKRFPSHWIAMGADAIADVRAVSRTVVGQTSINRMR